MRLHLPPTLRRSLMALMTTAAVLTCAPAEAGIMHEDASYQTYTDFGQNRGRYAVGTSVNALLEYIRSDVDKGIMIRYTDGTQPYIISNEQGMINFAGTDDIGAQVAISPTFAATVLHNGAINASYGERLVGSEHAINYTAIDLRGSDVFRLAPDTGTGKGEQYDYMLQRQSKIVTDAAWNPVTSITDMDSLDGQLLYHSGAGGMGVWREDGGKQGLAGAYTYIIGGINRINDAQTHVSGDATNTSVHQNPNYGDGVGASVDNPLPNAIQGGDSGSPVFIYNSETGQYEYLAAQQSGGGNSYGQARGNVAWTHETLASFDKGVKTVEGGVVKLSAIDTAGDVYTDKNGKSTQVYTGVATDANGTELVRYRGVRSGLSTWSDLSDIKDLTNWYAYSGHLAQPVTDLFFNDNLVFTAGAAQNTIELQDTVDLGVGYVEFKRGDMEHASFTITAKDNAGHLLNSAGYVVNEGTEVHISFTNPENHMYEWRKNGAGDLYIEGSGDTNALLSLGGSGTTYLKRDNGYAAYNVLASSGARVVIDNVQQIERGFTFGAGGGTLDLNGNSMDWYSSTTGEGYFTINALTEQAMIVNNGTSASELTYRETGNQKYAGSWQDSATGALRINYEGGGTWELNSIHTNLQNHAESGLSVNNGTVRLVGTNTVHGMGSVNGLNNTRLVVADDWHYADAAMDVTVKGGGTFELGSHARLSGDIAVDAGGTYLMREGVKHRYEYVEGGAELEDTNRYAAFFGHKGDVSLAEGASMLVEYSNGTTANTTYAGNISGAGSLSVDLGTAGGTLTLSGNNSGLSGEKSLLSGGLIATTTAALGNTTTNKWLIDNAGWLRVNDAKSPTALLAHVDAASDGTLALTGHTDEAVDMSTHRGLYLGAGEGLKIMYGDVMGYTSLAAVDGAWRLGGGGGELLVYHELRGANNLLLGADASSTGTVTLRNSYNSFSGNVVFNSRGILLKSEAGALGNSTVQLNYGNRLLSTDAGVLRNVAANAEGMLMLDELSGAAVDLSGHSNLTLAANSSATLSGNITLAEGAAYRLGAADNATLTVQTALESDRDIIVDAQGYGGGKVVLAGNDSLSGDVTVRGSKDGNGGDITLALGRDVAATGTISLEAGSKLDVAGHTLTVQQSMQGSGGAVVDSAGEGSLVFDTTGGDISSAANLQLATVSKVGGNTLTLGGSNSFENLYVEAGTLKLGSGTAAGSGTVHLGNQTTLDVGSGTAAFRLALAGGNEAQLTQTAGATSTLSGSIAMESGSRLRLTGTGTYALSGSSFGGEGAEIAVETSQLHFTTNNAVSILGTLSVANDLRLYSNGTATDMARNISNLSVSNGATVTLDERTWNTVWNIGSLNGTGNLLWNSNTTHSNNSRLILAGEGNFTGNITLDRNYANAARTHGAIIELAHNLAAQNATITLDGAGATAIASLAINTGNARIKGLSGNEHSYVYAGPAQVGAAITGDARPATTRAAVLTIDTDADYSYAGALGNAAEATGKGLSLVKQGIGTQSFTGSVSLNDISVHGGTLDLTEAELNLRGNVGIATGATLAAQQIELGEGRSFSVLSGSGQTARLEGELVLAGGTLSVDASGLSQQNAVFDVESVRFAEGTTGQVVNFTDFLGLEVGTYTVATGDWGNVVNGLTAGDLIVYDGAFSTTSDGTLQVTLSRAAGVNEWAGSATGEWNLTDSNWAAGSDKQGFTNGETAFFTADAALNVASDVSVQNLVLGNGVSLTTQGALQVSGNVLGGTDSVWTIGSGTQQLTESQAVGVEQLVVAADATLQLTGTLSSAALNNVSGDGTVVINYATTGNGTGYDFRGFTGTVQLERGLLLVSSSTFGEQAPDIRLTSANSQLVFNGTGTVLNSNVELLQSTTVHVNKGKTGTMAGVVSGNGGFTKAGGGELTFTAQNTYAGATTIRDGRLVLDLATPGTYTLNAQVSGGTLAVEEGTTLAANGNNISSKLELNGGKLLVTGGDTIISGTTTGESAVVSLGRKEGQAFTDGGNLTFNGRVDTTATVEVGAGKAIFAYTGEDGNRVSTIDAGLDNKAAGQVVVKAGAKLDVADALYLSSGTGSARIEVEQGAEFTHAGLAVLGTDETPATIKAHTSRGKYSTTATNVTVSQAHVAKTAEGAMTLANKLENVRVQNSAAGKLTLTNSANTLSGVQATGGDVTVLNSASHSLDVLAIEANRAVAAYTGSSEDAAQYAAIQVNSLASFGAGAVLSANLELGQGSVLHLEDTLTLNGSLTLGSGVILAGSMYEELFSLEAGDSLVLVEGLSSFTLGSGVTSEFAFANLPTGYTLVFEQGEDGQGGALRLTLNAAFNREDYSEVTLPEFSSYNPSTAMLSVGSVSSAAALVPEPTTATLSLLALAALAARRRRR